MWTSGTRVCTGARLCTTTAEFLPTATHVCTTATTTNVRTTTTTTNVRTTTTTNAMRRRIQRRRRLCATGPGTTICCAQATSTTAAIYSTTTVVCGATTSVPTTTTTVVCGSTTAQLPVCRQQLRTGWLNDDHLTASIRSSKKTSLLVFEHCRSTFIFLLIIICIFSHNTHSSRSNTITKYSQTLFSLLYHLSIFAIACSCASLGRGSSLVVLYL